MKRRGKAIGAMRMIELILRLLEIARVSQRQVRKRRGGECNEQE